MLNLKKTALAVIALGSTAAFAGTMGPVCSAVNVTVPCENTAWDLGGRALYVQPTSSALQATREHTDKNGNVLGRGNNPAWAWGFQFEGSYHYSTGNDFNVNWYHLRADNVFNLYQPVTLASTPGLTNINSTQPTATTAFTQNIYNNQANTAWDQVNMEFGQHVDFGENKFGRFHAGMQFAHVGQNAYIRNEGYTGSYGSGSTAWDYSDSANSVYNGFGARTGMDLTYDWGNGLSVYGTGALGLLAGTAKTSNNLVTYTPLTTGPGLSTTSSSVGSYYVNATRVVPTLDAKLGLMYTYAMAQGDLSFDIGWLWNDYIGALATQDIEATTWAYNNNFGVQGLYFGLKWVGNVA